MAKSRRFSVLAAHPCAVPAEITDAYAENPQIANLLLVCVLQQIADDYQQALRDVVAYAVQNGIPVPDLPPAAVAYYDSYRAAVLPANLIRAQRDYFGALYL